MKYSYNKRFLTYSLSFCWKENNGTLKHFVQLKILNAIFSLIVINIKVRFIQMNKNV